MIGPYYRLHRLNTDASVGGYAAGAYAGNRLAIFDVRPQNCVRTSEGIVVPFDVIPQVLNRQDAAALRRLRRPQGFLQPIPGQPETPWTLPRLVREARTQIIQRRGKKVVAASSMLL